MTTPATEEWRPVNDYPAYEVSSEGRVRRIGQTKAIHVHQTGNGHLQVGLWMGGKSTMVLVHRLVAQAFHGDPPTGGHCHHLNECKTDNRADNLKWMTSGEHFATAHRGRPGGSGHGGKVHQVYVRAVDEPMVRWAQELSGTNFSEMVVQAVREYIRRQGKAMEEAANGADKEGGSDE